MLIKDNNYRVIALFFANPEKTFHIRQIAKLTHLSAPGVMKIVHRLKRAGLLLSEKGKVVRNIRASKSDRFVRLKRCWNIEQLFESGFIDALRDVYEEPEAIVLFGSFAKGEDTSISDVDIAVIAPKEAKLSKVKFEHYLKRKINIYTINMKRAEPDFVNSLANGLVIYGFLKVI